MTAEDTMRDVLGEAIELRDGYSLGLRDGYVGGSGDDHYCGGGYVLGIVRYTTGTAVVEIRPCGFDPRSLFAMSYDTVAEAEAEFRRVKEQLELRERVGAVLTLLGEKTDVLPAEFVPSIRAGDLSALLIAADFRDDQGEADKALLLRAAYFRLTGQANVAAKSTKKTTLVFNPQEVSKRHPNGPPVSTGLGGLAVAEVTPGESVRIVSLDTNKFTPVAVLVREYHPGDQAEHGSFNLVYYGPVLSITAKTVVVGHMNTSSGEKHRMTLAKFVDRNRDFDLAAAQKRNSEYTD